MVTFTEEIINGKLHFLCSDSFNFVSMRFAVEVIFFPFKFYRKVYFYVKFETIFCYFLFILIYDDLDE